MSQHSTRRFHRTAKTIRRQPHRLLMIVLLLISGNVLFCRTAFAGGPAPGTVIENQATGSFVDEADNQEKLLASDKVMVTVAEVAGITLTNVGVTGVVYTGNTVYFDFLVSNIGNDPTQFFLPDSPSSINGGVLDGSIQVIGIDPDGAGTTAPVPITPISVPTGGQSTGTLLNGVAGANNGSFDPGVGLIVRVPVKISAASTQNVVVVLGNTDGNAITQNQVYQPSAGKDVYTIDNAGTNNGDSAGDPVNGDSGHRQEASSAQSKSVVGTISGTVFEDVNYGGGAGRNLTTSNGVVRPNATVELYKDDGSFVATTTTGSDGKYYFHDYTGDFLVRVVNSTVTSSRPGTIVGLLPVQTFRTDGTTGILNDLTNRVGGERPNEQDPAANNGTQSLTALNALSGREVQSLTRISVPATGLSGIDFGYNFDTIVNTNDSGQGSLRQFITNSNTLTNAGLAQVGQPIGKEVSIFMLADGAAHPGLNPSYANQITGTGGNANAAVIALSSQLVITDADTSLDGRTQTVNVGDRNTGSFGTGNKVGVDQLTLDQIPKPEIVLNFSPMPPVDGDLNPAGGGSNAIVVGGDNTTLAGFAYYGYRIQQGLGGMNKGTIWVKSNVNDANRTIMTQLFAGTLADGTIPPAHSLVGYGVQTSGAADIYNNYFAYLGDAAEFDNKNGTTVNFFNNELFSNGPQTTSTNNPDGVYADQLETIDSKNINIIGNLIRNASGVNHPSSQGKGLQISGGATNITVENNTFDSNRQAAIMSNGSQSIIRNNIITGTVRDGAGNYGSGVIIVGYNSFGYRNLISQNSTYDNAALGIDLLDYVTTPSAAFIAGVSPNNGTTANSFGNTGIDYPIITFSALNSGSLQVKGFVGNKPPGDPAFGNVTIEVFIADNDPANQDGEVILGGGKIKPHGEGKTYIGSCTANANGLFDCTFGNAGTLGLTDPKNITATATDINNNTSEFGSILPFNPGVLLVKRITAINGSTTTVGGDNLAGYMDDPANIYDDNSLDNPLPAPLPDTQNWPDSNNDSKPDIIGGIKGGNIRPGDEIEYTIYFLSNGESEAKNVLFCDRVPSNTTFLSTAFNPNPTLPTKNPSGLSTGDRGILWKYNNIEESLTNAADGDPGRYIPPGTDPQSIYPGINCGGPNINGAVVVNLGELPNATAPGIPTKSFGFIRFRGKAK